MAQDIDPITGLPPLTYERPQTAKIEESLEQRLLAGGESIYQKAISENSQKAALEDEIYWLRRYLDERKPGHDDSAAFVRQKQLNEAEIKLANLAPPISREQAQKQYLATGEGKLITGAKESLAKEQEILGGISQVRLSAEQEMARELQRRMETIGYQEGEARATIGESGAKRGLLRSTFTQSGIEQSSLREQERIGVERIGTQANIQNIRSAEVQLVKGIENQREKLLTIRSIEEIEQLERERNMLVESEIRTNFMKAMAQAQIDAQKKAQMMGTITSLASTAITAAAIYGASGCWVARAIFGADNIEWLYARTYVIQDSPNWFYRLYMKHGEKVSKVVEKSLVLKLILKPIFNYFAYKGEKKWLK